MAPANDPFTVSWIPVLLATQQQKFLELAAKEIPARRPVERQRGERVEHAVAARVAAIAGFDADQRNDHRFRHAELAARPRQHTGIFVPVLHPAADAADIDEQRFEFVPGLAGRRCADRLHHALAGLHLREQGAQRMDVEAMRIGHLRDELFQRRA
jgi:hypothetical protein